jgi:uncharacterized protein (TIGR03546 family)
MMLKAIVNLLKFMNSESDPGQISLAFCFSMVAGLTPFLSLHNILILLLVLFLKVNLSAFILGFVLFSGMAYMLDPLFHRVGFLVLTAEALSGLWTGLYNITILRLENFNNSVVMGSVLFSILFFLPLHITLKWAINNYRQYVFEWVKKLKLMQIIKASKFYKIYTSISG